MYTYVRTKVTKFSYPDERYLIECCKTHFCHLKLKDIHLDIVRGVDLRKMGEYNYEIIKDGVGF